MSKARARAFSTFMAIDTIVIGLFALPTLVRRDWAMTLSKFWVKTLEWGLEHIAGIKRSVIGAERLPSGPAIIASKHQSMWETIALTAVLPHPSFVMKKELAHIPIFGWWCARAGFIFVDRSAGAAALKKLVADAEDALAKGTTHIIIFPEGTRVKPGTTGRYQPGMAALAKALRLPVVPVAHNSGSHWGHHDGTMTPGTVTLHFAEPVSPDLPRAELMRAVEGAIEPITRRLEAEVLHTHSTHASEHPA